jgi:hypothetical protein
MAIDDSIVLAVVADLEAKKYVVDAEFRRDLLDLTRQGLQNSNDPNLVRSKLSEFASYVEHEASSRKIRQLDASIASRVLSKLCPGVYPFC